MLNGLRFGLYASFNGLLGVSPECDGATTLSWLSGTAAGVVAALVASPFALVRTRLQAQSDVASFGHQHAATGAVQAFRDLVREDGIHGLYFGASTQMMRVGVTTGLQLAMYDSTKQLLRQSLPEPCQGYVNVLTALSAGVFTALLAHPVDTVLIRVYHQTSADVWYSGPLDAAAKAIRTEGVFGLYKGFSATFLRQMPHTAVTFLSLEWLRNSYRGGRGG